MNLRKNFYTKEGIIKNDFRDQIVKEINENLKNAKSNNSNMILFPEYCFPIDILPNLRKFSKTEKIWIIGGIERCVSKRYNLDLNKNAVFILSPNKAPIIQLKHFSGRDNPPFHPGKELYLIDSRFGVFCVLICADFLEDSLLLKLREQVDFIIIICFNKDINEFRTRAYNKCLANNCYIIITNILKYKGYCIHAPFPKSEREYFLSSFPYCELDFTEFTLHRRKIEISKKYKKPLSDTLYNYGFHYFKK